MLKYIDVWLSGSEGAGRQMSAGQRVFEGSPRAQDQLADLYTQPGARVLLEPVRRSVLDHTKATTSGLSAVRITESSYQNISSIPKEVKQRVPPS